MFPTRKGKLAGFGPKRWDKLILIEPASSAERAMDGRF